MIFGAGLRLDGTALAIMFLLLFLLFVLLFMTLIAQPVQAQSFNVIYTFTGSADGQIALCRTDHGCSRQLLRNDVGGRLHGS